MAFTYGPAQVSSQTIVASNVTVTTASGAAVALSSPVTVNSSNQVSFAVEVSGVYTLTVRTSTGASVSSVQVPSLGSTNPTTPGDTGTGGTVAAPTYANAPVGSTYVVPKNSDGTWPVRPSSRTDICFMWKGPDPSPTIVTTGTSGMLNQVDIRLVTP